MHTTNNGSQPMDGLVLIQARDGGDASELAALVAAIPGVTKAQRVNGAYDIIAKVGDTTAEASIRALDGVLRAIPLTLGSPSAGGVAA